MSLKKISSLTLLPLLACVQHAVALEKLPEVRTDCPTAKVSHVTLIDDTGRKRSVEFRLVDWREDRRHLEVAASIAALGPGVLASSAEIYAHSKKADLSKLGWPTQPYNASPAGFAATKKFDEQIKHEEQVEKSMSHLRHRLLELDHSSIRLSEFPREVRDAIKATRAEKLTLLTGSFHSQVLDCRRKKMSWYLRA